VQKTAEMPQLSFLTDRASLYGSFGDPEVLCYLFLAPVSLMRGLKTVNFDGPSDEDAKHLSTWMTSKATSVDHPNMFSVLQGYVYTRVDDECCHSCTTIHVYLWHAHQAMDMGNLLTFKYLRKQIVSQVADHEASDKNWLCEYDP
jgi:hypothetical protein